MRVCFPPPNFIQRFCVAGEIVEHGLFRYVLRRASLMDATNLIVCAATALLCAVFYLRPVSRAEKAYLVQLAEGDSKSMPLVDDLVAKKWLTWAKYDDAKRLVTRRRERKEDDAVLAKSAARIAFPI